MLIYMEDNVVIEIYPESNIIPNIPLEELYPPDIIEKCTFINDSITLGIGYTFDPNTGTFSPPVIPEPEPIPEPKPTSISKIVTQLYDEQTKINTSIETVNTKITTTDDNAKLQEDLINALLGLNFEETEG